VGAIQRLPLPVKSSPGFLVNRVLMPYLMEALTLVEEGVSPAEIDRAAVGFGMPMGPVLLADTVGLDICLSVARILGAHFGGAVPRRLESLVAAGHLGKKTGQGFYAFRAGRPGARLNNACCCDCSTRRLLACGSRWSARRTWWTPG